MKQVILMQNGPPLGEFGIVYKALLKKGFIESYSETVAVKTLKGTNTIPLNWK